MIEKESKGFRLLLGFMLLLMSGFLINLDIITYFDTLRSSAEEISNQTLKYLLLTLSFMLQAVCLLAIILAVVVGLVLIYQALTETSKLKQTKKSVT